MTHIVERGRNEGNSFGASGCQSQCEPMPFAEKGFICQAFTEKMRHEEKKRLEITVEKDERFIFKRSGSDVPIKCTECGGQMITTEVAVTMTDISSRDLHRRAEGGQIHFVETAEGLLLVCLDSLLSI